MPIPRMTPHRRSPFLLRERITPIGSRRAWIARSLPLEPSITFDGIRMEAITSERESHAKDKKRRPTFRQRVPPATARNSRPATTVASQEALWMYSVSPLALQSLSLDPRRARVNSDPASCIRLKSAPRRHRGLPHRRRSLGSTTKPDLFPLSLWHGLMNSLLVLA